MDSLRPLYGVVMVTDSFVRSDVSNAWILVNLVQLKIFVGFRRLSFCVDLVLIEVRTKGTSFLLSDLFNSLSAEEVLSTLFLAHNSSHSVRKYSPYHQNVFSASCVALEPLVHRSAGLRLVATYRHCTGSVCA